LLFILRFDLLEFFLLFDGVEIFEVEDFLWEEGVVSEEVLFVRLGEDEVSW
jgi:hypothetical protein